MARGLIIVEGPDFAGKTTLINNLSKTLKAMVIKDNNIPPGSAQEVFNWIHTVNHLSKDRLVIADRSHLISDPIYSEALGRSCPVGLAPSIERLTEGKLGYDEETGTQSSVGLVPALEHLRAIIWCDPGDQWLQQITGDHMAGVTENILRIAKMYRLSQALYEYLDPIEWTNLSYNFQADSEAHLIREVAIRCGAPDPEMAAVKAFHTKFKLNMPEKPTVLPPDVFEFRNKFLAEELQEFREAWEDHDLVKMFDSLLDLVYVAKGTALLMGITPELWEYGFNQVQQANMTKVRAASAEESKRGSTLDVIKPEGWVGPEASLEAALKLYTFETIVYH